MGTTVSSPARTTSSRSAKLLPPDAAGEGMGSLGRETGSTLYRWWSQVPTPDAPHPVPCPPTDLDWRAILLQVRAKRKRGGSWVGRGEEDPGVTTSATLDPRVPSPPMPCSVLSPGLCRAVPSRRNALPHPHHLHLLSTHFSRLISTALFWDAFSPL